MPNWHITFRQPEDRLAPQFAAIDFEAEYRILEDGWFTFKDDNHKVVYDVPADTVRTISQQPAPADDTEPTILHTVTPTLHEDLHPYSTLHQNIVGVDLDEDEAGRMIDLIRARTRF